jgi:hypothetical protein
MGFELFCTLIRNFLLVQDVCDDLRRSIDLVKWILIASAVVVVTIIAVPVFAFTTPLSGPCGV